MNMLEYTHPDWSDYIKNNTNYEETIKTINCERDRLKSHDIEVFPSPKNIFRCFNYLPPSKIKVVILGQDPYHRKHQATGLCFGVNNGCIFPPSLKNIEKELLNDIGSKIADSTLENWASQGVLLLNSALTVIEGNAGSHSKHWDKFIGCILRHLNEQENIIFIAWGAFAYKKLEFIDQTKHTLIVSSHPSPLSARRQFKQYPSFIGSRPFSKINNILNTYNMYEIKW